MEAALYNIRVEGRGFKASKQNGVKQDAAGTRSLTFQLTPGEVSKSVEVTAATQHVETTSGSVRTVITEQQVNQLALNGREYIQLLRLAPGAAATTLKVFNPQLATNTQAVNGEPPMQTFDEKPRQVSDAYAQLISK